MELLKQEIYNKNATDLKNLIRAYYKRHLFHDGTPLCFSFLVTNRCFLKCKHCFYYETINNQGMIKSPLELTIDEFTKLSNNLQWFFLAIFCGGEPFVREDLHEIIKIFRTNNEMPWCDSATNGQLTGEIIRQVELICQQDKNKIYSLSFSIDGFEEENNEIRGKGTFSKAMATWNECKKLAKHYKNLELNLCTTINAINQKNLFEFFDWSIKNLHPNRITLLKIRQAPRSGEHLKNISTNNYKLAKDIISNAVTSGLLGDVNIPQTHYCTAINNYVLETMSSGKRSFYCYAGKHGAWIDYNGDVNVCEIFAGNNTQKKEFKIGNLRDYNMNFEKLWNSEKALKIKQMVGKHHFCANCTHETEGMLPSVYFEPNTLSK